MTTPRKLLEKTGAILYLDDEVLETAPTGKVEPVEVFKVGRYISDDDLEKEYQSRGLVPANLPSLVAIQKDHDFIATHWKNKDGKWCYTAFYRWIAERRVIVYRNVSGWSVNWSFGGVRKSSETKNLPSDPLPLELIINGVKYLRQ